MLAATVQIKHIASEWGMLTKTTYGAVQLWNREYRDATIHHFLLD